MVLKRTLDLDAERGKGSLCFASGCLGLSLLGEKNCLDVGQHTTLGNGDTRQQLVQLLVVADSQLQVTGDNSGLLVVTGSVTSQLKDFSSQVFEHGGQVDWSASTHTFGIVSFAEKTVDTTDGELQACARGPRFALSLDFSSFSTSGHDD